MAQKSVSHERRRSCYFTITNDKKFLEFKNSLIKEKEDEKISDSYVINVIIEKFFKLEMDKKM